MGKKKKKTEQKVIVYRSGVLNHADADRFEKACEAYLKKIIEIKKSREGGSCQVGDPHARRTTYRTIQVEIAPTNDDFRARIPRV